MNILNRKELFITYDSNEQARVRNILADHKIDYSIKTIDRTSPSPISAGRRTSGVLGQDMNKMCEYIIYVHKSDYEQAAYLIRK